MPRVAVVLPGGRFGPHTPTVAFPRFAAEARGASVTEVEWSDPDAVADLASDERERWVRRQVVDRIPAGERPLLIGRSLGTYGSALAADLRAPAVWVSPLLTDAVVAGALRRRTAPVLLAGGTEDPYWDSALALELADVVVEIDGADHGVMRAGPLAASAAALGELITAVEGFLGALDADAWPG